MGTTTAQPSATNAPRQLSDGNSYGTVLGQSATDFIGFYGLAQGIQQPGSQGSLRGVTGTVTVYATTQSPTSVAPNTSAEQALTVTGVATGQLVIVNKPTSQAGLAVGTARVSATNTIQVTFGNDTAATITPTATETYFVTAVPASMLLSAALTPVAVQPNTTAEQIFSVAGLPASAAVQINKPTAQAGLIILGARAVAAGSLGITFGNLTAATITPTAAETYLVFAAGTVSVAPVATTFTAMIDPASVAANTSAEQTFTVAGLVAGTAVFVSKASVTPGLGIGGARVSAANTLAINFVNNTATAINPTLELYTIMSFPTAAPAAGSSTAFNASFGGSDHASMVALNLVAGP